MANTRREPPDSPGHALWEYIVELEHSKEYYPWYRRASARHKWAWGLGQATTLLAGVLASVLAAWASNETFSRFGLLRIALIVLPVVSAVTSSLLAQTRVRELLALRGREAMRALIDRAKADYAAAATDPARLSALHAALVAEVSRLEREQAASFLSTAPGGPPPGSAPPPGALPARSDLGAGTGVSQGTPS